MKFFKMNFFYKNFQKNGLVLKVNENKGED